MNYHKKRKSFEKDYSKVNLEEEYKTIDLDEYKDYLFETINELESKLKRIRKEVKMTNVHIAQKCEEKHKEHKWVCEREPVLYGERYTFCSNCGVDYYDNSYLHK